MIETDQIKHQRSANGGVFYYASGGRRLAEMVYVDNGEKRIIIDHTHIEEALKGHGVGRKLLKALVGYVRENDIKVQAHCPFASGAIRRTEEWQDVLVPRTTVL